MTASRTSISVCMATFNGQEHLLEQATSILDQLTEHDELVVVDDGSTDTTKSIVRSLGDRRVRLLEQSNAGHVAAFERALLAAKHELLVLADQDDIWPPGRLDAMAAAARTGPLVAGHLQTFGLRHVQITLSPGSPRLSTTYLHLLLGRAPYYGSAMALSREAVDLAIPFPNWIEAHDHWLAICAATISRPIHLGQVVTLRREHGANVSPHARRRWGPVARTRGLMLAMFMTASTRRLSRRLFRDIKDQ